MKMIPILKWGDGGTFSCIKKLLKSVSRKRVGRDAGDKNQIVYS